MRSVYRFIFACGILIMSLCPAKAQLFPRARSESSTINNLMVTSAMRDALCIIHFEYQMEDTVSHQRFNAEGKDYFGIAEGFLVKTEGGWISPTEVSNPWSANADVKKFPEYKPVVSVASVLSPGDSLFRPIAIPSLEKQTFIQHCGYSIVKDKDTFTTGLTLGKRDDLTEGFVVWLSKKDSSLSVSSYAHIQKIDSTIISLAGKFVPEGVVGGVYVKPTYPSLGVIRFELLGILDYRSSKWEIVMLDGISNEAVISSERPKLVPATNNKKNKHKKK